MTETNNSDGGEQRARGRRPLGSDAKGDILQAALKVFSEVGLAAASIRGIAREAGVDPALIHHYFSDKNHLFVAATFSRIQGGSGPYQTPMDLTEYLATVETERLGYEIVLNFVRFWDSSGDGRTFAAIFRAAASGDDALAPIREFISQTVIKNLIAKRTTEQPELRGQLVATQIIGLGMARWVAKLPDVADSSAEQLAGLIGPTLQRYLTATLSETA